MLKAAFCTGIYLLTLALESCIAIHTQRYTIIDLGGALAEPGQMKPTLRYEKQEQGDRLKEAPTRLWKKGDRFIIEIPVAFIPARYSVFKHSTPTWRYQQGERKTLNTLLYCRDKAEPWEYPTEHYYAELTMKQLRILLRTRKSDIFFPPPPGLENVELIPADRYDLSGTALIYDSQVNEKLDISRMAGGDTGKKLRGTPQLWKLGIHRIPPRRTWYNRCLQPLSWCAELVDIPLSMLATPIGWLADAIYEPLNN